MLIDPIHLLIKKGFHNKYTSHWETSLKTTHGRRKEDIVDTFKYQKSFERNEIEINCPAYLGVKEDAA